MSRSICHHQYKTSLDRKTMYNVPNGHPENIRWIKLGEIIGVNPNSYSNIKKVLCNLILQTESDKRTWIRVGFDGVLCRFTRDLIDNTVICLECGDMIDVKEESFEEHLEELHHGEVNIVMENLFGNLLLACGPGHIEKNFLLTVFTFTKNIFILKVADKLGFKSTKAKEFIINRGDYHLFWEIAMIVIEAIAKELIHVYIEHCNDEGVLPNSSQLMIWHNERVINPNFNFYYDLIFTIMLGLKSYHAGIRRNNFDHAITGRWAVDPLMFIGNHLITKL